MQEIVYTVLYSQNYVIVESLGTFVAGNLKSVEKNLDGIFTALRKFLEK
jgi:hypothetical protein